jgi:hypothetical protein
LLSRIPVFPFDLVTARVHARLSSELGRKGFLPLTTRMSPKQHVPGRALRSGSVPGSSFQP